ncbi:factor H binding protein domain-containing protein [Neisseria sp.]
MSLQKISAATIIALSLAACSSGSDSNGNNQPNVNPSVTNPSNGNTSTNATPRVDFSVSYQGLKSNANEAVQYLAKEFDIDDAALQSYTVKLGNQTSKGKDLDLSGYPLKKLALNQDFQETAIARAEGKNYTITQSGKAHIYRQNYSLIAGINPTKATLRGPDINKSENFDDSYILIKGQTTQTLPTAGKFDYSGIASDGASQGKLAYSVDFDSRKGSGKITGVGSDINLHEASIREGSYTNEIDNTEIKGYGIQGSSNRGDYALGFFGPNAEEIVGTVNDGEIGFAGSR